MNQRFSVRTLLGIRPPSPCVPGSTVDSRRLSPSKCRGIADLHQAIRLRETDTVERLIDSGVDVDGKIQGMTPLSLAVTQGQDRTVELLLAAGVDVDARSRDHNDRLEPPLFTCCRLRKLDMAHRLLGASADVNKTDFYGHTPLWMATREQSLEIARLLLEHGARVNAARSWNECPLYLATRYLGYEGRRQIAELLVRHGIEVNLADDSGRTPLYWALKNCDAAFARTLVECGGRIRTVPWPVVDAELAIDLRDDRAFYEWLKGELAAPPPLKRLCLALIRQWLSLANDGRSILDRLYLLPLPKTLVRYVALHGVL